MLYMFLQIYCEMLLYGGIHRHSRDETTSKSLDQPTSPVSRLKPPAPVSGIKAKVRGVIIHWGSKWCRWVTSMPTL